MIGRSIIWANHIHSLHLRNCSLAASILLLARAISNIKANGLMMFGISWIALRFPVHFDRSLMCFAVVLLNSGACKGSLASAVFYLGAVFSVLS